ncbi:MAG: carboxypeptidase regulatory-like domain-containing protein, partial [Pyrinomonadaceae bacterium]|nr:carboxypeptidase regulatory-like domain-containing protein [Pyrinomonadaceae bacterium]
MEERMKKLFWFLAVIVIMANSAFTQSTTGRLIGTVSGTDGLLPGATVTVVDNQTGRELTAVSNDEGSYRFEQLTFGTYTVRITQQGFKTFVANEVKIDANRDYSLNTTLEVGAVEAEVTVQAGADIINTSNGELSTTVSPRQILELPINGRNPLALLNLQAGVNATSNSINGQRSSSQNYTRDGVNIQDNFIRTGGFVQDRP